MINGRQTVKLREALKIAREVGIQADDRARLYDLLAKAGYNWSGKAKTWSENNPWTGSAFEDAHGKPTGHFKLRLMSHPNEEAQMVASVLTALRRSGFRVTEVSTPYSNRNGVGVRTYITGERA